MHQRLVLFVLIMLHATVGFAPLSVLYRNGLKTEKTLLIIPVLQPDQRANLTLPVCGSDKTLTVEVIKPTGFSILTQTIDSSNDTRTSNR